MRNVAILVDGGFYLKQYQKHFGYTDDVGQVVKDLMSHCLKHIYNIPKKESENYYREPERLYRIFFYDCPPIQKKVHHPLTGAAIDFGRSKTALFRLGLHNRLRQTRNVALRLGFLDELNARWEIRNPEKIKDIITGKLDPKNLEAEDIVYYARQKNVDMKLGLDIASLAYKRLVDKIVLISGDSDFVSAAKEARKEGIEFVLDAMHAQIKIDLQEHIDALHTTLPPKKK